MRVCRQTVPAPRTMPGHFRGRVNKAAPARASWANALNHVKEACDKLLLKSLTRPYLVCLVTLEKQVLPNSRTLILLKKAAFLFQTSKCMFLKIYTYRLHTMKFTNDGFESAVRPVVLITQSEYRSLQINGFDSGGEDSAKYFLTECVNTLNFSLFDAVKALGSLSLNFEIFRQGLW